MNRGKILAVLGAGLIFNLGSRVQTLWSAEPTAGFHQPSREQLSKLYDYLTAPQRPIVRMTVFTTITRVPETDAQLLADLKDELSFFTGDSAHTKSESERDEELKAMMAREKLTNDGKMCLWERESKISNAFRLDRTIYDRGQLPKSLAEARTINDLREFQSSLSNHFDTTIVIDKTKGPNYNFQIHWKLGSSTYSHLPSSCPVERGLSSALYSPSDLRWLLLTFARNTNKASMDGSNKDRFMKFLSDQTSPYQISVLSSNLSGIAVDSFQIHIHTPRATGVVTEFGCNATNYNCLYWYSLYNTNGNVTYYESRADYDENQVPYRVNLKYHESNSTNWTDEVRQVVQVLLPENIDRDSLFGFYPPDSFSISQLTDKGNVMERYSLVSGKRLGPASAVRNDGVQQSSTRHLVVRTALLCAITIPGVFLLYWYLFQKRKLNAKPTNDKI